MWEKVWAMGMLSSNVQADNRWGKIVCNLNIYLLKHSVLCIRIEVQLYFSHLHIKNILLQNVVSI